jgi:hypothetical protein
VFELRISTHRESMTVAVGYGEPGAALPSEMRVLEPLALAHGRLHDAAQEVKPAPAAQQRRGVLDLAVLQGCQAEDDPGPRVRNRVRRCTRGRGAADRGGRWGARTAPIALAPGRPRVCEANALAAGWLTVVANSR